MQWEHNIWGEAHIDPFLRKVYRRPLRGMQSSTDAPRIQSLKPTFSKED